MKMQDIIAAVREDMIEAQLTSDQYVSVMITCLYRVAPKQMKVIEESVTG